MGICVITYSLLSKLKHILEKCPKLRDCQLSEVDLFNRKVVNMLGSVLIKAALLECLKALYPFYIVIWNGAVINFFVCTFSFLIGFLVVYYFKH